MPQEEIEEEKRLAEEAARLAEEGEPFQNVWPALHACCPQQ